ncbi:Glycosyltransferase [Mariniradius saccharolyticus AK6]|uniref:Glycosyltransferase n=1 Tax=Mariniradius saccharolyticus AK6 TaxID=1239962 RepID=M7XBQ5_9BACT|nr:glycosyltransferase family 2 protein [Mariniradius saccharolyticus]EMS32309.1 Glycosyltransferase [Mariniradius saccharolyticus AK6]
MGLVSILIPNYNKAPYLRETLESVIGQTYTDWECIVVDDHSTDESWEILESFTQKDRRIKIFRRPENRKKGGNAARNYAIELAMGEFVAFLDSDDVWRPRRLESAISFLNSQNFEAIFSGAIVLRKNSIQKLSSRDIQIGESVFDFVLSDDVFCPTPSLILKKELAQIVMFDEKLRRHQDYDFFIRVHLVSPWRYFENYDVQVNWTRDDLKTINYLDCLPFYEKHCEKSQNKAIRHKYIVRITSASIRESFKNNLSRYFRNKLQLEGYRFSFREYIMFFFPSLFHMLSKTKWFVLSVAYRLRII